MIVEFNKQVGERLESEIAEKDKKIFELEASLGKLSEAHFENAKDKVALCIELNETSNKKDHLNNALTEKCKTVLCLDESNNAIKSKVELPTKTND